MTTLLSLVTSSRGGGLLFQSTSSRVRFNKVITAARRRRDCDDCATSFSRKSSGGGGGVCARAPEMRGRNRWMGGRGASAREQRNPDHLHRWNLARIAPDWPRNEKCQTRYRVIAGE